MQESAPIRLGYNSLLPGKGIMHPEVTLTLEKGNRTGNRSRHYDDPCFIFYLASAFYSIESITSPCAVQQDCPTV